MTEITRVPRIIGVVVPRLVLVAGLMLGAGAAQASHGVLNPVNGEFVLLAGQTIDCGGEGVGIHLSGISDVHINGGDTGIVTNCTEAIRVEGGGDNHINAVRIENNTCDGIVLEKSSFNHLNGNIIQHNGCAGIKVIRGGKNHINGNTITDNNIGVFMVASIGDALNTNNVSFNERGGICLARGGGHKITSNIVVGTGSLDLSEGFLPGAGILLIATSGNVINGNESNENSIGIGVSRESRDNIIRGNTTNDNIVGPPPCIGTCLRVPTGVGIGLSDGAALSLVQGNDSAGNITWDLFDGDPVCTSETWKGNTFSSASESCIQ